MLVFSRKAGEAIVLPNSGVTIGVVAVKGGQVRLGITAPSEVSVRRGEIGHHTRNSRECGPEVCEAGGDAWQHEARRKIAARTHGHVLGLEVEVVDGRLIVHGRSRSYYGKQLACAAALELVKTPDSAACSQVELDIEVMGS